jgi:hypothetical protein
MFVTVSCLSQDANPVTVDILKEVISKSFSVTMRNCINSKYMFFVAGTCKFHCSWNKV